MKVTDFNYDLPEELIAQVPIKQRDESRLLVVDRNTGEYEDKIFHDIIDYLEPGDCLVRNNTKVIPARLYGQKDTGAKVEFLLLNFVFVELFFFLSNFIDSKKSLCYSYYTFA